MRALVLASLLAAAPAAADRLVAPSDLAPRGTVSAEFGAWYTRATVDLPMDDPYLHTVAAALRARVAPFDGVMFGLAQGYVLDRRVELFLTAGHHAAGHPDRFEVVGGMHARDENWSFAPRLRLTFDSPVDDEDRGAVGYGVELVAAIEFLPGVSFHLVAGLMRDRVVVDDQRFATTTLTVAGTIQGTHDFF